MINWFVRFQNKAFVVAFCTAVAAFIYQILGMFGIVPPVAEDTVGQFIAIVANLLVGIGVLVDPTTEGVRDSERALTYTYPH